MFHIHLKKHLFQYKVYGEISYPQKKTNGDFQFTFKDKNDQIVFKSQVYLTKENCKNGIIRVKKIPTR